VTHYEWFMLIVIVLLCGLVIAAMFGNPYE
jgi:hypothetical protein